MSAVRYVTSTDGVRLAVFESGDPDAATVVAVHGYPDNHTVWDGIVAELSGRFRVVTYDVRGTGQSDKPTQRSAYRMAQLVDDLGAVLDAVSPIKPVHLLAHDWGSIQAWPAVTSERFATRIGSFTSVSGPSLDHAGAWLRSDVKHPKAVVRQLLDSYYIFAFQIPKLPELLWRSGWVDKALTFAERHGGSAAGTGARPQRGDAEKLNGIAMYRANMVPRLTRPRPARTAVPVQIIAPDNDSFVSAAFQTQAPVPYVDDLTVRRIHGKHWVVVDRPDVIARWAAEFIDHVVQGTPIREAVAVARGGHRGLPGIRQQ